VAKDNTITLRARFFQSPKRSPFGSHSNKRIVLHVLLDGAVEFFHQKEKSLLQLKNNAHTWPVLSKRTPMREVLLRTAFLSYKLMTQKVIHLTFSRCWF